ncbi:hypothetical protein [Chryseobacterium sp. ISL-6]|uniref:hypothetical protein n=1 Tax=Chryseobacterium sp. ISL-6 TaxID=2819143 RepID=UPI001BE9AAEB|nr:hypothetical protein [Chryseobacterium sp. ISL-6]MBT2620591.1 hypothetical protein [Chryseobacterium sp. ISL-6]
MKKLYLLQITFMGTWSFAQVGVNSVTPKRTLDVTSNTSYSSTSDGFLIPRLTGNILHNAETAGIYGADQNAMLVFVTAAPDPGNRTGQVEGMETAGFYYFDAVTNRWVKLMSGGTSTAQIGQLLCSSATNTGILETMKSASGVNVTIPYNAGNGNTFLDLLFLLVG